MEPRRTTGSVTAGIHWAESGPSVASDGVQAGPILVLIHGTLDRMSGMAKLVRRASETHDVLRFDRRGYGDSWEHPGPFTVAGNVDDVVRLIDGRDAVLVGHSFGGNVALAAAALLGEQVVGVSTYETPVSWHDWWPKDSAGGRGVAAGPERAAESFMVALIGSDAWNRLPEKTREARRREGRALVEELGTLRESPAWDPGLVTCPVIVGRGTRAPEHHVRGANWIADALSGATSVIIEGAGHGAHVSHPEEFFRLLIEPHFTGA